MRQPTEGAVMFGRASASVEREAGLGRKWGGATIIRPGAVVGWCSRACGSQDNDCMCTNIFCDLAGTRAPAVRLRVIQAPRVRLDASTP